MITYVFVCQSDIRCYTVTRVKDCILDHQITILYDCIIDYLLGHQQVSLSRKGCGCCRDKKKNGLEKRKAVGFFVVQIRIREGRGSVHGLCLRTCRTSCYKDMQLQRGTKRNERAKCHVECTPRARNETESDSCHLLSATTVAHAMSVQHLG